MKKQIPSEVTVARRQFNAYLRIRKTMIARVLKARELNFTLLLKLYRTPGNSTDKIAELTRLRPVTVNAIRSYFFRHITPTGAEARGPGAQRKRRRQK